MPSPEITQTPIQEPTQAEKERETREEKVIAFAQGLRELADFYLAHPEVKLPYYGTDSALSIFQATKEEVMAGARAFGQSEKVYHDDWFQLRKNFSGGVALEFFVSRQEVCTPRVTGQKVIPEQVIPTQVIPQHTVDIVEYDCHPILAPSPAKE